MRRRLKKLRAAAAASFNLNVRPSFSIQDAKHFLHCWPCFGSELTTSDDYLSNSWSVLVALRSWVEVLSVLRSASCE